MVLLVGDVASDCRDREAFQEVDYSSFFGPSTKGFAKLVERIDHADRIPEYVARAFATAMNGRPGPVVLVLPEDMLIQMTAAQPLPRVEATQSWSDPDSLKTLYTMLLAAKQPLIIAGGGGGRRSQRWRCSASPKTGNCQSAMRSDFRTRSITIIRCMPATWALA